MSDVPKYGSEPCPFALPLSYSSPSPQISPFVSFQKLEFVPVSLAERSDPKYSYPYPAQGQGGYCQAPPVMAPPLYVAPPPPPRRESGFLEGCRAVLCCCGLIDEGCWDPSTFFCC